jgi:hypothetical protein
MNDGVYLLAGILWTCLIWYLTQICLTDGRYRLVIHVAALVTAGIMIWTTVFDQ